jgi:hypothetical protein
MRRNVTAVAITNNGSKMKTNNDSISISVLLLSLGLDKLSVPSRAMPKPRQRVLDAILIRPGS